MSKFYVCVRPTGEWQVGSVAVFKEEPDPEYWQRVYFDDEELK